MINNMAPSYRESVYCLMDKTFEIDWYFGYPINNIKEMNLKKLKNAHRIKSMKFFGPLYWQKGMLKLLRVSEYDIYIMLGELFNLSTWISLILRPIIEPQKKIYLWTHGWYGREGFLKKWIKRIFFSLPNGTFVYGKYAKDVAIAQGNDERKLFVIHNSLNHKKHVELRKNMSKSEIFYSHFNNHNKNIIFIGRLTAVKKLNMLIDAIKLLKDKGENYNLVFVGDGPEKINLESSASNTGIPAWFYGECYDEQINAELIMNADLCVAPGNVGLTAIHSLVFGTPVITHGNFEKQMPEFEAIQAGRTGDFFEEGSTESLSIAISTWFKNNADRNMVKKSCQNEIDSYWTPEYQLDVLKKVLTEK